MKTVILNIAGVVVLSLYVLMLTPWTVFFIGW